jgi:oxygen-independent coproporphyrinogen-3 oxidase
MPCLYLHIPFCRRKCPYCDFYSLADPTGTTIDGYPRLLIRHLDWVCRQNRPGPFDTIFFGGGTPSLLSPAAVASILTAIDQKCGISPAAEITLEANPDSLDATKLADFRQAGVNRLSIGLQSLNDHDLNQLQRPHNVSTGLQAVRLARQAGFTNISCDLMFNLPGQHVNRLLADLEQLIELAPEHIAVYGLTIEPGTSFASLQQQGRLKLPDDEHYVQAYRLLHHRLNRAGYDHYEISNFARPGFCCRHNLGYWQRLSCLGLGAGAHSFNADNFGTRYAVANDLATYISDLDSDREPTLPLETFDRTAAMFETLYLGLRTADGVSESAFTARFGTSIAATYPQAIRRCAPHLRQIGDAWRLDLDGWLIFDTLLQHFY